ncbi:MAG: prepilin-type N-terminal cleavage/methylation domain-containing protein [Candidatus Zambryskibacteria bacterium]|nr:prepilin-type N-terminal cleavage/methylation domain-containing protein [Candidatus Zambryskibacteria bacterium]
MNFLKYNFKKTGFTLVEVLVAISILSISILATFTAVQNSLKSTNFAEDQVIAYYLADEALEFIRNFRDSNAIRHVSALGSGGTYGWLSGFAGAGGDPCFPGKFCHIDVPGNRVYECSSDAASCPVLLYNASAGVYEYVTGTATQFKRSVSITMTNATEAVVRVQVSWTAQGISKDHVQSVTLRNWTE